MTMAHFHIRLVGALTRSDLAMALTRRDRLGQMWSENSLRAHVADYLHEREADISVVNVTAAAGYRPPATVTPACGKALGSAATS